MHHRWVDGPHGELLGFALDLVRGCNGEPISLITAASADMQKLQ